MIAHGYRITRFTQLLFEILATIQRTISSSRLWPKQHYLNCSCHRHHRGDKEEEEEAAVLQRGVNNLPLCSSVGRKEGKAEEEEEGVTNFVNLISAAADDGRRRQPETRRNVQQRLGSRQSAVGRQT